MDDQNKMISIFDFLEDSNDCALKNIDTGTIDFYDHFFDNVLIPKIFNLNNFQYIKDLSYYTLSNVLKLVRKNRVDNFKDFISIISKGIHYYEEKLEEKISSIEHLDILILRANGKKLSEIGEQLSVTKERVRQIEKETIENLYLYINTYLESMYHNHRFDKTIFFNFSDIFYFISNDDLKKAIIYTIKYKKENIFSIFNDEFSCFVHKEKTNIIKKILKKIKLDNYFNYFDSYSKLNNTLIFDENILDFTIDIYLNYLKNKNYLFKGNLAYIYGECSISAIISMVIKNYYPKGILLDEKGIKDFGDFINKLLNYPFKITSAIAKIDENNDDLILWGKLKRIHISNIGLNKEQLENILSKFKAIVSNVDYILFEDIYNQMESILKGTQITDKYKLYGVIKFYLNEDFYFKKMAVRKLKIKDQTISDLVYNYIDSHDMCSKDEIIAELFIPKSSLFAVLRDKVDIIVINEKYTLINKLNFNQNLKDKLEMIIKDIIDYVHRDVIFENNIELMIENNIVDSTMLFHILRYYFKEEFIYNSPYIQNKNYDKPVTMRNILLDIFNKSSGVVGISQISEEAEEITANKDFSLIYNLRVSNIDVFRVSKEEITLKDNVYFDDIVGYMINNRLNDLFEKETIAFMKDIKELSKGLYFYVKTNKGNKRYPMDAYSFCSYIEYFLSKYKVFNSSTLNNYLDASYVVCANCKCNSYIDVVYNVLKKNSKNGCIDRLHALKVLKNKSMISCIPNVMISEKYIEVDGDEIKLIK